MLFIPTEHPEVIRIIPKVYRDDRGFFMETYQKQAFSKAGINVNFVQDNHSSSAQNVLRGLHYQVSHIQGKLVRVLIGEIFDVAVDLRRHSPYFGKWSGVILSAKNKEQLWIPPGFAHGFFTLSETADVLYKTTDYYDAKGERCIRWDDPQLAIKWPIPDGVKPIISEKDKTGLSLKKAEVFS